MSDGGYQFIPSSDACDICAGMAGTYPVAPGVPVHENCRCTVVGPDDDCQDEIRHVQVSEDTYEAEWALAEFENCGNPAGSTEIGAQGTYCDADEGMDEYLLPEGDASGSADLPANSYGSISGRVQVHSRMAVGELWRVCTRQDPVAGTDVIEWQIGDVGAFCEVIEDVEIDVDAHSCG